MLGGSTTCMATCFSGARISTTRTTRIEIKQRLSSALRAAGHGSSVPQAAGPPDANRSILLPAPPASVFAWSFGCVRRLRNDEPSPQQSASYICYRSQEKVPPLKSVPLPASATGGLRPLTLPVRQAL